MTLAQATSVEALAENFPTDLMRRRQWLVWRFVNKPGQVKPAKMPYYATTGELRGWPLGKPKDGQATAEQPQVEQGHELDRAHLVTFDEAFEAVGDLGFDGVGFAFLPGDGLIGIDLDIKDDPEKQARADAIVRACGSWAEVSPSGKGLHIIVAGETETFKHNGIGIEVFCGRQFFTMSGRHLDGTPLDVRPIAPEVLAQLRRTVDKAKKADRDAKEAAAGPSESAAPSSPPPRYTDDEGGRVRLYCMTALSRAVEVVSGMTEGGRNDALNSETYGLASLMWTGMIDEATIRGTMESAGVRAGLPLGEVRATVNSAIRAGARNKKAIPEPDHKPRARAPKAASVPAHDPETGEILQEPPANDNIPPAAPQAPMNIFAEFPAPAIEPGMLPDAIAAYAHDCGELIGVDMALVAMPAVVACAAALHDDIKIQPKRHETGWKESARLWCAVVGAPSVRKTPAMMRGTSRLRKIDADLAKVNRQLAAEHADQLEQFKEAKKAARKSGEPLGAQPERPMMRRMVVEDITIEALSDVLKDNDRGVLCIQDELSGWFGSMDAYTGGKAGNKDRAAWLQAYNGGFRQVDRVMRGSVHIPNFSVSMIGGIQPDAIRRIAKDMTDDGLMQRFMIVIGRNQPEQDRPEDEQARRQFAALVDHLHGVQPSGNVVMLSDGAHVIRERLQAYAAELADYPALPGGLRSHLGKWSGLFARLLLTYHAIECAGRRIHPCEVEVSAETAGRVDALMRGFLLPHAMSYYTDILGGTSDLEHARWVAGHILSKRLETVSHRDLMQAYKQWRGLDEWRRQRVLQVLEDMSWLSPFEPDGRSSRRGATTWAVNPQVHQTFAQKAKEEAARRDRLRQEIAALVRR